MKLFRLAFVASLALLIPAAAAIAQDWPSRQRRAKVGIAPLVWTPAEFAARIKAEIADNIAVAKAAGIKPN